MKTLLAFMIFLAVMPVFAQNEVDVPLPDIPPGQELSVTYQVTINDVLQPNTPYIANQGTITGSNFGPIVTDDPSTGTELDATRSQLGFNLAVEELPGAGEAPWWRMPLLLGGLLGAGLMLTLTLKEFNGYRKRTSI